MDPDEPPAIQKLRRQIHAIRVSLIRAAHRLGYDHETGLVKQVLYRLNLAEKLKAPWKRQAPGGGGGGPGSGAILKRPDPALAAAREAVRLEQEAGGEEAPLGFTIKMMLVGLTGSGKTQLIHSLLHSGGVGRRSSTTGSAPIPPPPPFLVDPFEGGTKKVEVIEGVVHGIRIVCVDTPGLVASAGATAYNAKVNQQIKRAYNKHHPDLVLYVDRLDSLTRPGGELPALRSLSENLGPGFWLNTIVALSHAGCPAPSSGKGGPLPFETFAEQRSNLLQQIIRAASGDSRLMNPNAYVDSHPNCRVDATGAALIANGMPWKPHLYLMIVSAKLLADTENMLQDSSGSAAQKAKQQQQMMMAAAAAAAAADSGQAGPSAARQLPLQYLAQSLTQITKTLKYPDHGLVAQVRSLEKMLDKGKQLEPREVREVVKEIKGRLMQTRQAHTSRNKMQSAFTHACLAGGKLVPEPPALAKRRVGGVNPPKTYRYRVPEPEGGWLVRPQMEAHGMEASDGIEGIHLEKTGVARRLNLDDEDEKEEKEAPPRRGPRLAGRREEGGGQSEEEGGGRKQQRPVLQHKRARERVKKASPADMTRKEVNELLGGIPYQHSISAQVSKDSKAIQVHSEATLYHDTLGATATTLSADVQSTGVGGGLPGAPMDSLYTLRADLRRRWGGLGKSTVGLAAMRLAEGVALQRGPAALGVRFQHQAQGKVPLMPQFALTMSGSYLSTLPPSSASVTSMSAFLPGGGSNGEEGETERCLVGNLDLSTDLQGTLGIRKSLPLSLGISTLAYKGDPMTTLSTSMQYQTAPGELLWGRIQVRGKQMGLGLKFKSEERWWLGLIAMALPLCTGFLQAIKVLE